MPVIPVLSEESLQKLKRDHEKLRYDLDELRMTLRTLRGLTDDSANSVATTATIIPGRSGTTPGGPILVQRKRIGPAGTFVDYGVPVPVYSWVQSDSSDPASVGGTLWIYIELDIHGVWWFTGEDCPL